ncbi:hypothetical protein AKJ09_09155 [Labilithrix luteola]|uniref:Uncharacterized protein n=1 Tax=Labilithrix luteola TaxID=1391654 RepID=A0A0K1Q9Z1_9BACT|nr:hypothetical protein AKJ09_09155 [Labilithrix luteola]
MNTPLLGRLRRAHDTRRVSASAIPSEILAGDGLRVADCIGLALHERT